MFVNNVLMLFVISFGLLQVETETLQRDLATSIFTAISDNAFAKSNATVNVTTTRIHKGRKTNVYSLSKSSKIETKWKKDKETKIETSVSSSSVSGTNLSKTSSLMSQNRNSSNTAEKGAVSSTNAVMEGKRNISVVITGTTTIQLPHDSLILHAVAEDTLSQTNSYEYNWQLIDHPVTYEGTETMRDNDLMLTTLTAGSYEFKVVVSDTNAYGEGYVNITVLEPPRTNIPPIAVISPQNQVVTLPNHNALLDGSDSTDDDGIVRYSWEMLSKPLQASDNTMPADKNKQILELRDLIPGFYEFELTVTDTDGASLSTRANVTVKQRIDNKPIANAGSNILIYLPRTSVVLDGSGSSDDYGIVSYKWTLCPDSEIQGVDMQGYLTDTLTVTSMVAGVYSFCLTVSDTGGQQDTVAVTVNVQPESNQPPVAAAGQDVHILLPADGGDSPSVRLDASNSTDDKMIVKVSWKLKSGPNGAIRFSSPNALITDVTGLSMPGEYVITVMVEDEEGEVSSDDVTIELSKEPPLLHRSEPPPVADAGPDVTLRHLGEVAVLDGSNSHDEHGIKSYSWTRDPSSPSVGYIVEDQEDESKRLVVGLIGGKFTFHLTVTNNLGESSSDAVIVEVLPDPLLNHLVELHLNIPTMSFTEGAKNLLVKQIHLVLGLSEEQKVLARSVYHEHRTGDTIVLFCIMLEEDTYMPGPDVVSALNSKLNSNVPMLDVDVKLVDTYVCMNDCSGRGRCYSGSKVCECDSFWTENFIRVYLGDGRRNCDWSILYVAVVIFIIAMVLLLIGCYVTTCLCLRKRRNCEPLKRRTYATFERDCDTRHKQLSGGVRGSSTSSSDCDTVYDKQQLINAQPKLVEFKNTGPLLDLDGNRLTVCAGESNDELA